MRCNNSQQCSSALHLRFSPPQVKLYKKMRNSFTPQRRALGGIAVLSQYQHQVHLIREQLTTREGTTREQRRRGEEMKKKPKTIGERFAGKNDGFRRTPVPLVMSVVQSQGESKESWRFAESEVSNWRFQLLSVSMYETDVRDVRDS